LSQEALADQAEVRAATLSELETGKGNPRLSTLAAIAKALEVHVLDLFEDERDDPETQALIDRVRDLDRRERDGLAAILPRK